MANEILKVKSWMICIETRNKLIQTSDLVNFDYKFFWNYPYLSLIETGTRLNQSNQS